MANYKGKCIAVVAIVHKYHTSYFHSIFPSSTEHSQLTYVLKYWLLILLLDVTNFKGEMYADPDRALYHALGMTIENLKQTPSGEKKRSYLTQPTWEAAVGSIWVSFLLLHIFVFSPFPAVANAKNGRLIKLLVYE